jgi:hypothetical protein
MNVREEIEADVQAADIGKDILAFIFERDREIGIEVAKMFGGLEYFIPTYDFISKQSKYRYIVRKTEALTPLRKIAKDLNMGERAVRKIKENLIKVPLREALSESTI